jgi:hypothetical protein
MLRTKEDAEQQLILEKGKAVSFDSGSELDEDIIAVGDNSNTSGTRDNSLVRAGTFLEF